MQKENTRPLLGEVCVNNLIRKSVKLGIGTTPNFIKKKTVPCYLPFNSEYSAGIRQIIKFRISCQIPLELSECVK